MRQLTIIEASINTTSTAAAAAGGRS